MRAPSPEKCMDVCHVKVTNWWGWFSAGNMMIKAMNTLLNVNGSIVWPAKSRFSLRIRTLALCCTREEPTLHLEVYLRDVTDGMRFRKLPVDVCEENWEHNTAGYWVGSPLKCHRGRWPRSVVAGVLNEVRQFGVRASNFGVRFRRVYWKEALVVCKLIHVLVKDEEWEVVCRTAIICVDIPWSSKCAEGMCEVHSNCTHPSFLSEASVLMHDQVRQEIGAGTTNDGGFEVLFSCLHDVSRDWHWRRSLVILFFCLFTVHLSSWYPCSCQKNFKIVFRVQGAPHKAVLEDRGRVTRIPNLVHTLRTPSRTESTITDVQKTIELSTFSEKSRKHIRSLGMIELCELGNARPMPNVGHKDCCIAVAVNM